MPTCPKCGHQFTNKGDTIPDGFEEFWRIYPRRLGKGHAIRAYRSALGKTTKETLLKAALSFSGKALTKDKEFVPYPATWLNGMRWLDESVGKVEDEIPQAHPAGTPNNPEQDISEPHINPSWGNNAHLLIGLIGKDKFRVWFKDVYVRSEDGVCVLSAPSRLARYWIERNVAREVFSVFGEFRVIVRQP